MSDSILMLLCGMMAGLLIAGVIYIIERRDAPTVDLDEKAYERWIAAMRPDLRWFLALSHVEQERLAEIGAESMRDICVGVGYAVRDPAGVDGALHPDSQDAEVERLKELATATALKIMGQSPQQQPASAVGSSMGGVGKRREFLRTQRDGTRPKTLFGRKPKVAK